MGRRRSRVANKGWDTRIRREGYRQTFKAIAKRNPIISSLTSAKDMAMGGYKIAYPRRYRRNRLAKSLDKYT